MAEPSGLIAPCAHFSAQRNHAAEDILTDQDAVGPFLTVAAEIFHRIHVTADAGEGKLLNLVDTALGKVDMVFVQFSEIYVSCRGV